MATWTARRSSKLQRADLTGKWYQRESDVFAAAATLGIDTIEAVLLYHVIPGVTITSRQALKSNNATLNTALAGTSIKVKVRSKWFRIVQLVDNDRNDIDPFLVPSKLDINQGNRQIAHGISFVLRPVDL